MKVTATRARKGGASLFAAAVLGGAGVAIALVLSGDAATVDDKTIFCSEYVPNAQAESNYQKWRNQNPGERLRWDSFRDAICADQNPAPPTMTTAKGRGLVAAGKMALPESSPPPTTTTGTTTTTTTTTTTEPPPTTTEPPPPSGAAFFLSPSGNDSNACSQASPCRTLQRGFNVAAAGQVVELAGGSYPAQPLSGNKGSTADVVFRAASGANVQIGMGSGNCSAIRLGASHVTFENMTMEEACADGPLRVGGAQTDVTFKNVTAPGGFQVNASTNISFIGGVYGPASGYQNWNNGIRNFGGSFNNVGSGTLPTNILIDGATVRNVACAAGDSGCHIECLIVGAVDGLTVRNSKWYGCAVMDVFFESFNGPIRNVTFENNWMADGTELFGGSGTGRPSLQFKGNTNADNVLVRFNSLRGPVDFEGNSTGANRRVIGNVGTMGFFVCRTGVTYAYNFWQNHTCGSTDRLNSGALPFVNPSDNGSMNYHLGPTSVADNLVTPTTADYALAIDYDGQARNAPRDAGSDER